MYHECECCIKKTVSMIFVYHNETNCDFKGWTFLSHPYTNNELFFCPTLFFYFEKSFQKLQYTRKYYITWWRYFGIAMVWLEDHVREFHSLHKAACVN